MSLAATDPGTPRPPLGVGQILKETVSILTRHIGMVFALCFLPLLLLAAVEFALKAGAYMPMEERQTLFRSGTINFAILLNRFATGAYGALVTAGLIKYTYDLKLEYPAGIIRSAAAVPRVLVPLVICNFLVSLIALLGLYALILPGLYLAALWCVLIPSIVLEKSRFQAFNRSAFLTRNYRWPLVAVVAAFMVPQVLISLGFTHYFYFLLQTGDPWRIAIHMVTHATITTLFTSLSASFFTLVYLRLRDIKEGTAWLADVFD